MTEEEAKKKWCPMIRGFHMGTFKRHITEKTASNCIASECMMWRWKTFIEASDKEKWGEKKDFNGYCGLGGKNEKT
jgi:hypothetical protein